MNPEENEWERFGVNHSDTLPEYIEGPCMTKHNGKYYLQYGAPSTKFNVYGDGAELLLTNYTILGWYITSQNWSLKT